MFNQLNIIHHGVFRRKVSIVVGLVRSFPISKRHALSEVSMFCKYHETVPFIGKELGDIARVSVLLPDIALVTHVEENRT